MSTADSIAAAARRRTPMRKSPDTSCSHPMTYGPAKPPRFPNALMNATPAAAALPRKSAVGSDQNTGV